MKVFTGKRGLEAVAWQNGVDQSYCSYSGVVISVIWVYTVFSDPSVPIFRTFMVFFFYVKYKLTESSGATKSMCSSQMKCYFKVPFKGKDLHRYLTFLPQWTLDQMTGRQ